MKQLFFDELIGGAWKQAKEKIWFWVGLLILVSLIPNIPTLFNYLVDRDTPSALGAAVVSLTTVLSLLLAIVISIGQIRIFLSHEDKKKLQYADLIKDYKLWLRFLGAMVLYFLVVVAGILLFIIPGIIWGLRFKFVPWLIVDKKIGAIEAFRASAKITNGNMWSVFLMVALLKTISIIGFFALLIGTFWAYPTMMIIEARFYRTLSKQQLSE